MDRNVRAGRGLLGLVVLAACADGARGNDARDPAAAASRAAAAAGEPGASDVASAAVAPTVEPARSEAELPRLTERTACDDSTEVAVFSSPRAPPPGAALRVLVVSERPVDGALAVVDPAGAVVARADERRGGPPFWWSATFVPRDAGRYRVGLGRGDAVAACEDVRVGGPRGESALEAGGGDAVWPVQWAWERDTENLYAAWIERLFDAPLSEQPSWHGLSDVLGDPDRNFLHDHLGLGEDRAGRGDLALEPDCADLPFFLRAYFAWKVRLPFGHSECTRGRAGRVPECDGWRSVQQAAREPGEDAVAAFARFLKRDVGWRVHSGSGRTALADDRTDLYPIRIATDTLRPGVVYADPYGHTLLVVKRIAQVPPGAGVLLAVDAQPDGTVARKRYWRGNFLFSADPSLGGPGFKRFRPVVVQADALRPLSNAEIARHPEYGDFSAAEGANGVDAFYERVDAALSPIPPDPAAMFRETIQALDEQIRARVASVANGEAFVAEHPGTIRMPEGAEIFETTGAWEDYATPSRDLRLLVAIDVVQGFPARAAARVGAAPDLRAALDAILAAESSSRRVTYRRTDGSEWTLTLGDVVARAPALEVAYDPNDCVEVRWGARPGSDEATTCRRRAPAAQAARMAEYRAWFHERRRPPR